MMQRYRGQMLSPWWRCAATASPVCSPCRQALIPLTPRPAAAHAVEAAHCPAGDGRGLARLPRPEMGTNRAISRAPAGLGEWAA